MPFLFAIDVPNYILSEHKNIMTGGRMTEDTISGDKPAQKPVKTQEVKIKEHYERILRTSIGCFMGILAGALSFVLIGDPSLPENSARGLIGILLLLAAIVFQKQIFLLMKIDVTHLGGKDWFYQGFMALSLWFISWTILLTVQ
jgi:hypothetical protein